MNFLLTPQQLARNTHARVSSPAPVAQKTIFTETPLQSAHSPVNATCNSPTPSSSGTQTPSRSSTPTRDSEQAASSPISDASSVSSVSSHTAMPISISTSTSDMIPNSTSSSNPTTRPRPQQPISVQELEARLLASAQKADPPVPAIIPPKAKKPVTSTAVSAVGSSAYLMPAFIKAPAADQLAPPKLPTKHPSHPTPAISSPTHLVLQVGCPK